MRAIYCPGCRDRFVARYSGIQQDGTPRRLYEASASPENGSEEWGRIRTGIARGGFRCDACSAKIMIGSEASAVSVWKQGREPGLWESVYIGLPAEVTASGNGRRNLRRRRHARH